MVVEVLVAPVQGPQPGGHGVVQAGDWEAAPVGSESSRHGGRHSQMVRCLGATSHSTRISLRMCSGTWLAPTLDAGDVKLRKPGVGHVAMIAARCRIGYAGASSPVCWTLSNASAG